MPDLSIVLPVYNEGPNIEVVLRGLEGSAPPDHETLVVYDFDEDDTLPAVRALQPLMPAVRLVRNRSRGVLSAMRTGMAEACSPYVLVAMADGSDDPRAVPAMLELARHGAAVVAASRYTAGGAQRGGPRLKSIMSRTAGLLLHHLAGLPIHDPTNNFKLYSRAFLDSTPIESVAGFELALELTVKAHRRRLEVAEVPTTWTDRTAGQSRFDFRKWLPHYVRWFAYGLATRFLIRIA